MVFCVPEGSFCAKHGLYQIQTELGPDLLAQHVDLVFGTLLELSSAGRQQLLVNALFMRIGTGEMRTCSAWIALQSSWINDGSGIAVKHTCRYMCIYKHK